MSPQHRDPDLDVCLQDDARLAGSVDAMNDTDIICRAGGSSVTQSTCLSGGMRSWEHTQGYTPSIAERNKQTLDHLHAWTRRTCLGRGFPS